MLEIRVKKLNDGASLPKRGSKSAAGFDLYALNSETIDKGQTVIIHTGLALEIPEGYFGAIYARSGLATKKGLRPANCVGVIDSDYRGEVMVALHNDSGEIKEVERGERVAQLVVQKFEELIFSECDELGTTKRGEDGFGSTGSK